MTSASTARILIVDDDAGIRESLKMTLEYEGYIVDGAATGQEGLNLVERDAPDLVLLDLAMPGIDGVEVRRWSAAGAAAVAPADIVVEGFGARLPDAYVAAMAARTSS